MVDGIQHRGGENERRRAGDVPYSYVCLRVTWWGAALLSCERLARLRDANPRQLTSTSVALELPRVFFLRNRHHISRPGSTFPFETQWASRRCK